MPAKTTVIPDILAYLKQIGEAPDQAPYERLLANMREAGHIVYIKETGIEPFPDSTVAVRFDVLVGPDPTALERLDAITTRVAANLPHVSLVARLQAEMTLVYMLFGRMPPQTVAGPARQPAPPAPEPEMNGHEVDLAMDDEDQEYVEQPETADAPAIRVIARREADGLPIFFDLYEVQGKSAEVIDAVLDEIQSFLADATSTEQIDALIIKNPTIKDFFRDLGETEDVKRLLDMVTRRKGQVAGGVNPRAEAPRRRSGGARAN